MISEYNRQISSDIYQATGRGSTLLSGKGAYQQNNTDVLYAVVSQSQIGTVKKIVNFMMKVPSSLYTMCVMS